MGEAATRRAQNRAPRGTICPDCQPRHEGVVIAADDPMAIRIAEVLAVQPFPVCYCRQCHLVWDKRPKPVARGALAEAFKKVIGP